VEVQKVEGVGAPSWVEEAEAPLRLGAEGVVTLIAQKHQERRELELEFELGPGYHSTADT
jgi:hypothetical protein